MDWNMVDYSQHNHKILENQIVVCLVLLIMFDYKRKPCGCGNGWWKILCEQIKYYVAVLQCTAVATIEVVLRGGLPSVDKSDKKINQILHYFNIVFISFPYLFTMTWWFSEEDPPSFYYDLMIFRGGPPYLCTVPLYYELMIFRVNLLNFSITLP